MIQSTRLLFNLFIPFILTVICNSLFGQTEPRTSEVEKPTGTIYFLSNRDGNFEVYSMDATGSEQKNLTNHPNLDYWVSYNQLNGLIYFYSNRHGNNDIYYMNKNSLNPRMKPNNEASNTNPQISPDGLTILFQSDWNRSSGEIYSMNIQTNETTRLTDNEVSEDVAAWSPDGKTIVYSKDARDPKNKQEEEDGDYEIFTMNADGTNEKQLTQFTGFVSGPCFSPDGTKIAVYGRGEDGYLDLFVMNANGSDIENITHDSLEQYSPSWSPDGKWLAYTGGDKSNYDIWIVHLKTGQRIRLTTEAKRDETPVWVK